MLSALHRPRQVAGWLAQRGMGEIAPAAAPAADRAIAGLRRTGEVCPLSSPRPSPDRCTAAAAAAAAGSLTSARRPALRLLCSPCALLAPAWCRCLLWRSATRWAAALLQYSLHLLLPAPRTACLVSPSAAPLPAHHPAPSHFWHLQLPTDVKLNYFDAEGNMQEVTVGSLTKGKKVRALGAGQQECFPFLQHYIVARLVQRRP